LTIDVSIFGSIVFSSHIGSALTPGHQARDWKQRFQLVQDELQTIQCPHTGTMSSESIHRALQRLFAFFISAYHLKDALKDAASRTGVTPSDVEEAVNLDPRLALLADLANLDKHMKLSRPPRSGTVPLIGPASGVDRTVGSGWQLSLQIMHGAQVLDGLAVAADAVNAWREKLNAWRLI
jgi:hypothetical protein